jgi:hypothetical protein
LVETVVDDRYDRNPSLGRAIVLGQDALEDRFGGPYLFFGEEANRRRRADAIEDDVPGGGVPEILLIQGLKLGVLPGVGARRQRLAGARIGERSTRARHQRLLSTEVKRPMKPLAA